MKILHVMNDSIPWVGGYTARSRCIVTHQRQAGIKPFVITSVRQGFSEKATEMLDGIPYIRTNWPPKSQLRHIPLISLLQEMTLFQRNIQRAISKFSPRILHVHSPVLCAIPAIVAARKNRIPIVYEIRAFWEDAAVASRKFSESSIQYRLIRLMESIVCRLVDRVIPISQSMKRDLFERGIPEDKLFVVPNGVDSSTFKAKSRNSKLAAQLGLNDKTVIGYLGTFYDFEGIDDLIRAFGLLQKEEENVALLLIGGGEMEKSIRDQVLRLNDPRVVLLKKVPPEKTPDYYALMDILVYPRKSVRITEMTTPLKPLEAMALGKPVICSDVGGLREMVGEGNGLFFQAGNDQALVHCLKKLIRTPRMAEQLGSAGRRRAFEERSWSNLIKRYLKLYETL